ncbi:hypothetical protein PR048_002993 [Dryococelus australis]|uniref:Reverse transcriptase/retrotransposon-derived protein RNase H-like domain-containing protein n=1 Tax=Dryococelus australis TaxID=614101 RepID=A0ABQ9ILY4_9NEOP|nr:hypothetical protein PR048_002993 [Dryococelus australis]
MAVAISTSKIFSHTLKLKVSSAPVLAMFDPEKEIILQCDASQYELGFQHTTSVTNNKLAASSFLTDKKELLATYFVTAKSHDLIYGHTCNVRIDHKPLVPVMNNSIGKIGSPRLQQLRIKLLKYTLYVYYVRGKDLHLADAMSHMPALKPGKTIHFENCTQYQCSFIKERQEK